MVVTRARDASVSVPAGPPPQPGQQEANPPAAVPPTTGPPPEAAAKTAAEQIATLSQQVQNLTAMVHGIQQQQFVATQHQTAPPASQQSARGGSPRREAGWRETGRRPTFPRKPHRGPPKRPRSPDHGPGKFPPEPRRQEGPRRKLRLPSPSSSFSSSSSSSEPSRRAPTTSRHAEERMEEYNRRLDELARKINHQPEEEYNHRPPLSRRIMEKPVPPRFRLPQLDPYDGTTDPLDHLESYKVLMQVQGATDSLLCVAFPATLRKAARAWYSRLPPRSINSFRQLERSFLAHFDACRRIPRVADSLFAVQQRSGETLRDFVARFKEAALEVYNLEDSVATLALRRGLRPSRFAYSLDKKPPSSYAELLSRAQKYIRADEADSSRREAAKSSNGKPTPTEPAAGQSGQPEPPRRFDHRPQAPVPKEQFTPLMAPISHILLEIEEEPYFQHPRPLKTVNPRNKELYCRYHRDYGHDTEDCRHLKRAIEGFVQQGHLGKFVRRNLTAPGASAPPAPQTGVDNAPTEKTIA